jgi:hypothetical protein
MNIKIFLKILLWNLVFTVSILIASVGIYFLVANLPFFVSPLILFGVVLMGQLYFDSWLLGKRRIYNLRNLIYCFLQLLFIWFIFYVLLVVLIGE